MSAVSARKNLSDWQIPAQRKFSCKIAAAVCYNERSGEEGFPSNSSNKMNVSDFNPKTLWKPFAVAAALAFVYASVLAKLGIDWWTDANYSHGLLVPFVIGGIVYIEFDDLKKAVSPPSNLFGFALILSALLLLLGGTLGAELFTQRISLVVMLAGVVVYFFGRQMLKSLAASFALLLLAIPIPQIIFNKIAFPLQIYASRLAVWGIRLFEVPSLRKGNVIEILPDGATQIVALEVVEACSGIRSLMTLVTLALILAYFTRSKNRADGEKPRSFLKNFDFWRAVMLMLSAIPIAVFTNAARVTATGFLTYLYGKRAAEGTFHEVSGWLVYVVALAILFGLNLILKRFKIRASRFRIQDSEFKIQHSALGTQHLTPGFRLYPLLAVLLIGGISINWFQQRGEVEVARQPLSAMASELGDWQQKGDAMRFDAGVESVLGATDYTQREYVSRDGRTANLYVGYYASQRTGATYHSPQNCLPGAGWIMKEPELVEIKTSSGSSFTANKFIVENGIYREVLIYWYQGRGRRTASEYADKINTIWDSARRRRNDGALVRVMTAVNGDEAQAAAAAIDLSAAAADNLSEFVPE
ncbi:MAG: EpsI family protein [Acidobacteriota bacterium]|nr:EpsI family protein [Acidobacteriota bacterium]